MTKENTYKGEKLKKSNDPKPIKRGKNANERVSEGGKKPKSKQGAAKSTPGGATAKDKSNAKPKPASGGQAARNVAPKRNRYPDYPAKGEVEEFPHFRKYKKSNHPALIVSERSREEYNYRKVTSAKKDGRHLNEEISPNPDKTKETPMYIGKRIRSDKKSVFSRWKYPWNYPKNKKK